MSYDLNVPKATDDVEQNFTFRDILCYDRGCWFQKNCVYEVKVSISVLLLCVSV
jgi:hypothetical protein